MLSKSGVLIVCVLQLVHLVANSVFSLDVELKRYAFAVKLENWSLNCRSAKDGKLIWREASESRVLFMDIRPSDFLLQYGLPKNRSHF
jgi:hypothetical protein